MEDTSRPGQEVQKGWRYFLYLMDLRPCREMKTTFPRIWEDLGEISGEPLPAAKQGHRNKHPAQHLVLCLLYTVAFGPQGCGTVPTRAQGLLWPQSLIVPV